MNRTVECGMPPVHVRPRRRLPLARPETGNFAFMFFAEMRKPAWRNGLARWTSNPKVVGSNPTVGVFQIA